MALVGVGRDVCAGDGGGEAASTPGVQAATGAEPDSAVQCPVPADLLGRTVAHGEAKAGQQALAQRAGDLCGQTVGQGAGPDDPQFQAHGEMPEEAGKDGADDGADGAADDAGLGVGGDDLHAGDDPDQDAGHAGCAGGFVGGGGLLVGAGEEAAGEQSDLGGGKQREALGGVAHAEVVLGEAPRGVRRVGGASGCSERGDDHFGWRPGHGAQRTADAPGRNSDGGGESGGGEGGGVRIGVRPPDRLVGEVHGCLRGGAGPADGADGPGRAGRSVREVPGDVPGGDGALPDHGDEATGAHTEPPKASFP